jgi:hypothetical protein
MEEAPDEFESWYIKQYNLSDWWDVSESTRRLIKQSDEYKVGKAAFYGGMRTKDENVCALCREKAKNYTYRAATFGKVSQQICNECLAQFKVEKSGNPIAGTSNARVVLYNRDEQ